MWHFSTLAKYANKHISYKISTSSHAPWPRSSLSSPLFIVAIICAVIQLIYPFSCNENLQHFSFFFFCFNSIKLPQLASESHKMLLGGTFTLVGTLTAKRYSLHVARTCGENAFIFLSPKKENVNYSLKKKGKEKRISGGKKSSLQFIWKGHKSCKTLDRKKLMKEVMCTNISDRNTTELWSMIYSSEIFQTEPLLWQLHKCCRGKQQTADRKNKKVF